MDFNLDTCEGYRHEIRAALLAAIDRNQFILGENVRKFERAWAEFNGARYCVGVGNGTDAIRIALLALGVGPGDAVLSPAHNVSYTALAVKAVGAKNVYVDIDPNTMLMDFHAVERALAADRSIKVIVPVHLYGQMVDMERLAQIAARYGVIIVEDAAQCHGASFGGVVPGQCSAAAAFSFYPTKNLGAWGEAGGIVTSLPIVAERARLLRDGGRIDRYIHLLPGLNSCLDELQAAVLNAKLPHLTLSNSARRNIAQRYIDGLKDVGDIRFQYVPPEAQPVWHLFVIRTHKRDALLSYLAGQQVPALIHYPVVLPHQPFAVADAQGQGPWPTAEWVANEVLSLPMHPHLRAGEQDKVIAEVRRFYGAS